MSRMSIKFLSISLLLSFSVLAAKAQQLALSAGGELSSSAGQISFSIGQVVYTTPSGSGGSFSQGMQQTEPIGSSCIIPVITNFSSSSSCGKGNVILSATPSAGVIQWYTTPTGGVPLVNDTNYSISGTTVMLLQLASTKILYAEAVDDICVSIERTAITATVYEIPAAPTIQINPD